MGTTELSIIDRVGDVEVDGDIERATTGQVKQRRGQRGMVSAEWAVGIIAAVALAGVLIMVITHGPVQNALLDFILKVIDSFSGYIQKK